MLCLKKHIGVERNKKYWRDAGSFFGDDYLFLGTPRTAQFSWTVNF